MESVRVDIEKEHHAIDNSDIVVFFRVTEFITSFQYHKFMDVKVRLIANSSFVLNNLLA